MGRMKAAPTIALISHSSIVSQAELGDYVAPYQAYVSKVLKDLYEVDAEIVAPANGRKPHRAWPMYFVDQLNQPGALGYHSDSHHQPAAYIDAGQQPLFTGSHELAEMLVDPSGNSLYPAPSPDPADNGKEVQILDEDASFGIEVEGVSLSDVITSNYGTGAAGPYDAADKLTEPREVAINGYVSWIDDHVWKQATRFAGEGFKVRVLGPAGEAKNEGKSLREWVDEQTRMHIERLGISLMGGAAGASGANAAVASGT